ncbi:MAG TPA: hypothetical protein VMU51_09860 [Mycobacteriales bacterium]|nr:hypothetical protein [Mycobacteriales bacterium]
MADGRQLDLQLQLLDRQVVDAGGRLVCKVDDLELTATDDGRLLVTAILIGPRALGPRIGGRLGRWMAGIAQRLSTPDRQLPPRIDFGQVTDIGTAIAIARRRSEVDVAPLDDWVDEHLIGRIPGAGHAS